MTILQIETPPWALPIIENDTWSYLGLYGGRGTGKSHFLAEKMIEDHVIDQDRSSVCLREVQKSVDQSVKKLLCSKIDKFGLNDYFIVQDQCIKSKRGKGIIIFNGLQNHTAESIKSLEAYDCAWIEEAQSISAFSWDTLRPTIRRKKGSQIWASWNPNKPDQCIDNFFRGEVGSKDASVLSIRVNFTDNPWFGDELRSEMERDRQRDFDTYRWMWLGEYRTNSDSVVFKNWRIEEFEAPDDAVLRFGADWGFATDPTTLVRCYIVGRKLYVDYEAYKVGCEIVDTPTLFMSVPDSERWPIVADSARPETISYMRSNGFSRILPAVKGPKSVEDGIEWLRSFEIIVHPRCVNVIRELASYAYKVDKYSGQVLPLLDDKNNHTIDALRYACESARRGMREQERKRSIATVQVPRMFGR